MRSGAEYFTDPSGSAQRRYEALRAYFVEDLPAAEVADRFAYSTASVHQMATQLRKGRLELFTRSKPPRWTPGLPGPCWRVTTPGCCCCSPPSPSCGCRN